MEELKKLLRKYLQGKVNAKSSRKIRDLVLKLETMFVSLKERENIWYFKIFGSEKLVQDLGRVGLYITVIKQLTGEEEILSKDNAKASLERVVTLEKSVDDIDLMMYKARKNFAKLIKSSRRTVKELQEVA